MKAACFHEHGGVDKLRYEDVATPSPGPGEALIRVKAAALNHLDLFVRQGLPHLQLPLPFWTGSDVAGEVTELGPGVAGWRLGERVAVNPNLTCGECEYCLQGDDSLCVNFGILGEHVPGGLADYVKVRAGSLIRLPDHVSFEDAAAFILVNMTAWRMLVTQARLRAAEDVLILGVGGGVASAAVQIAKLCGARVWVTSSSDQKLERAKAIGADELINYSREDWPKVVWERTGRRGVDVVLDSVGAQTWKGSLRCLARGGRLVTCGATSGPIGETDIRLVFWKQIRIIGSTMANRREVREVMAQLFRGALRSVVDRVFPLREAAQAQALLAEGKQFGKLVLVP